MYMDEDHYVKTVNAWMSVAV